jgi:rSAM/selenodomain-associated transferase 1
MSSSRFARMGNEYCVMMFVKAPEKGVVKSRIAASLGEDMALDLYQCFVSDLLAMLSSGGYPLKIFFYPPGSGRRIASWLGNDHHLIPQTGHDLGERMGQAFGRVFSEGVESALLIGSDSPDLPRLIIDEALAALEEYDAVVGPSLDGGYYLIGFRRDTILPQVFHGISWSTPGVFAETMGVLRKEHRSVYVLPPWRDIDTPDDLRAFCRDNRSSQFAEESATIKYVLKAAIT